MIRVSNCVSNELAGSKKIVKEFESALKVGVGAMTKDKKFSLEMTGCIGMCDEAPAIMVNDMLVGKVTPKKVKEIIKQYK